MRSVNSQFRELMRRGCVFNHEMHMNTLESSLVAHHQLQSQYTEQIECGGDSGLPIVQYITYKLYSIIELAFHVPTHLYSSCTTYSCCTNTPRTQYHVHHVSKYMHQAGPQLQGVCVVLAVCGGCVIRHF